MAFNSFHIAAFCLNEALCSTSVAVVVVVVLVIVIVDSRPGCCIYENSIGFVVVNKTKQCETKQNNATHSKH